ncbi:MAG: AAA family ATPase [Elusimicrobiota bacterium]
MKRDIYKNLLEWKKDQARKPLILKGARQVGKTYILKEFGKHEYQDLAYFNFEEDPNLKELFNGKLEPAKILEKLSIDFGRKILPGKNFNYL